MPDEIIKLQNVHVQTSTVCASESISNANIQGEQGFVDNLQWGHPFLCFFFLAFYCCLRTFTSVWDFQFSVAANQYTSNPVSPNLPGPRAQASLAKETEDSGNEKW